MAEEKAANAQRHSDSVLLSVKGLRKVYRTGVGSRRRTVTAVNGVSFDIKRGETLGLVGESGSGKSTIGRLILRLIDATEGTVEFDGIDLETLSPVELRRLRSRMQIVFQDPASSLDSRMTVREIIAEPLKVHGVTTPTEIARRVGEILELVGIPGDLAERKPHALSGGQRQRVALARSLVLEPSFIVLDEPVTALDVSVQAQVLNLLMDLREKLGLTFLFIVHDLALAEQFCHRVAVLYRGEIVELAPSSELFTNPKHPYSKALFAAAPVLAPSTASDRQEAGGCA